MQKSILTLIFVLLCITNLASAAENRYALVIGNAAYPTAPLENPVNDATDMAAKLKQRGFTVTRLVDANQQRMEQAIKSFTNKLTGTNSVGIFYYAGHGLEVEGENYIVPVDAELSDEEDVKYKTVNMGQVLDRMNKAGNGLNLVILDACRNNPFKRGWRGFQGAGLAQMQPVAGTLIMYAAEPGKEAQDGKCDGADGKKPPKCNGTFTKFLLPALEKPDVEVEAVFKEVSEQVSQATAGKQVPWFEGVIHGHFMFRPSDSPTTDTAALAKCQEHLQANRLISGAGGNAFDCYRNLLEQEPANIAARAGLTTIIEKYQNLAKDAITRKRPIQAQDLLAKAEMVRLFIKALPQSEPTPTHPTPTRTPVPLLSSWTDFVGQLAAFLTALATLLGVIWQFWRHRSQSKSNPTYIPEDLGEPETQVIIEIERHKETPRAAIKPTQLVHENNKGIIATDPQEEIPQATELPSAQLTDERNTGEVIFTQPIVLNKSQMSIGRDDKNDIVLNKNTVSSCHAVIRFVNGNFQIEDLQSGNGTLVNGKRLEPRKPMPLASGDVISLDVYQFRFELSMGTTLRDPSNQKSTTELPKAELLDENASENIILTKSLLLNKPQIRIGRTANNDLVIDRGTISSSHAVIQFVDGQFQVEDLGSGNGTSINGKRLAAHQPKQLASGDVISFDVYQFRFVLGTILRD